MILTQRAAEKIWKSLKIVMLVTDKDAEIATLMITQLGLGTLLILRMIFLFRNLKYLN